jgi:hypothetical protein
MTMLLFRQLHKISARWYTKSNLELWRALGWHDNLFELTGKQVAAGFFYSHLVLVDLGMSSIALVLT